MATHSSILAWRIPRTEEPGRLQSREFRRIRHDCRGSAYAHSEFLLLKLGNEAIPAGGHGSPALCCA